MLRSPKVLLLSSDETERGLLQDVLGEHDTLTVAGNLPELRSFLELGNYDGLFCAQSSQTGTWKEVLEDMRETHPDLPVIILPSMPETMGWASILEAGTFNLLVPPYEGRALLAVVDRTSASRDFFSVGANPQRVKVTA